MWRACEIACDRKLRRRAYGELIVVGKQIAFSRGFCEFSPSQRPRVRPKQLFFPTQPCGNYVSQSLLFSLKDRWCIYWLVKWNFPKNKGQSVEGRVKCPENGSKENAAVTRVHKDMRTHMLRVDVCM